jgi:hypothetical protein
MKTETKEKGFATILDEEFACVVEERYLDGDLRVTLLEGDKRQHVVRPHQYEAREAS